MGTDRNSRGRLCWGNRPSNFASVVAGTLFFARIYKCKTKHQSWLCFRRDTPPSPEDVEFYEQQMLQLKKRVAELDAEDAKLRIQEIASRDGAGRINFRNFYPLLTE